jgi:phage-related minor tail protein
MGAAAMGGEGAFKRMAKVILEELAKLALDRIFTTGGGKAPFFGGKAAGGAVNVGGAYLVGERGPELFVPTSAGRVEAGVSAPREVRVSINVSTPRGGDTPQALQRSSRQVASAVRRALTAF